MSMNYVDERLRRNMLNCNLELEQIIDNIILDQIKIQMPPSLDVADASISEPLIHRDRSDFLAMVLYMVRRKLCDLGIMASVDSHYTLNDWLMAKMSVDKDQETGVPFKPTMTDSEYSEALKRDIEGSEEFNGLF